MRGGCAFSGVTSMYAGIMEGRISKGAAWFAAVVCAWEFLLCFEFTQDRYISVGKLMESWIPGNLPGNSTTKRTRSRSASLPVIDDVQGK